MGNYWILVLIKSILFQINLLKLNAFYTNNNLLHLFLSDIEKFYQFFSSKCFYNLNQLNNFRNITLSLHKKLSFSILTKYDICFNIKQLLISNFLIDNLFVLNNQILIKYKKQILNFTSTYFSKYCISVILFN